MNIEFTRIKNDSNGNPRYVCHFLSLLTDAEKNDQELFPNDLNRVSNMYAYALARARKIGGRKFHNKQYGGGIVFQSYSLPDTEQSINEAMKAQP
jgi:hypothetical protein